jgi:hypothetical protein
MSRSKPNANAYQTIYVDLNFERGEFFDLI